MNVHQKPRAGILLEVDLSVRPESYYYYYYYLAGYVPGRDAYRALRHSKFECSCCEMLVLWCEIEITHVQSLP